MNKMWLKISTFVCSLFFLCSCGSAPSSGSKQSHSHSYSSTVVQPTCTTGGYTLHSCACGNSYKDNFQDALGHDYVEREQDYKCARCDRYEDEGYSFELITPEMARYSDSYAGRQNTYEVTSVSSKALENGKASFPRKHMSYPVSGVKRGALNNVRNTITDVYFPSNIRYIGSNLMSYDGQFNTPGGTITLASIVFDQKCSEMCVSHTAFQFCKNVNSIDMPSGCIKTFNHDDMVGNHFLFEDTPYYKNHRTEDAGLYYLFDMLLESDKNKFESSAAIKDGTKIIANQVFTENTNLKTVVLPQSVTYIGKRAFAKCASLATLIYKGTESQFNSIIIEENAFQDCPNFSYQFS